MRFALLFAVSALAVNAGGVGAPSVGYARDAAGTVVRVSGVSGAFVVESTGQNGVISAAFSEHLGFVKTVSTVRVLDPSGNLLSESEAPTGEAVFGFDAAGTTGAAWYPSTATLMYYSGSRWTPAPFYPNGTVLALAVKDNERFLAAVRSDQLSILRIRLVDGAVEDETFLGSSDGPALLFSDGTLLFRRERALVRRAPGGTERLVNGLAGTVDLLRMGADWIQVRTGEGRSMALRLSPRPRLFALPEVSQ